MSARASDSGSRPGSSCRPDSSRRLGSNGRPGSGGRPGTARSWNSCSSGASRDGAGKLPDIQAAQRAGLSFEGHTDLSIEVMSTLSAFNSSGLPLKMRSKQLKGIQVTAVRDIFLEVSQISGLGQHVFQQNFLEEIGNVPSMAKRFVRALVALVYTANGKPERLWPNAEEIVDSKEEQLKLLQELAQAASEQEAHPRYHAAKEKAKLVLSQANLTELKEERAHQRAKRIARVKTMGPESGSSQKLGEKSRPKRPSYNPLGDRASRRRSRLAGVSRRASVDVASLDVANVGSMVSDTDVAALGVNFMTTNLRSIFEYDQEELDEEVTDMHEALLEGIRADDVEYVKDVLSFLDEKVREEVPLRPRLSGTTRQGSMARGMWKAAVSNMTRIRQQNTVRVMLASLKRQDEKNEVLLHKVKSLEMYNLLLHYSPAGGTAMNWDGQTPIQVYTNNRSNDLHEIKRLACKDIRQMLRLDSDNVSTCMRLGRDGRAIAQKYFDSWEATQDALRDAEPLAALRALSPEGAWPEVLQYHLFHEHEVWEKGRLTERAIRRLLVVWSATRELLQKVAERDTDGFRSLAVAKQALSDVKELLEATKGPRTVDTRLPYRDELTRMMIELQLQSENILDDFYASLKGEAAAELSAIPSGLHPDLLPDTLVKKTGIQPSLRMDFDLEFFERVKSAQSPDLKRASSEQMGAPQAAVRLKLEPPGWVLSKGNLDWKEVLEDLQKVGMVENNPNDSQQAHHQLLQLAIGLQSDKDTDDDYNFQILHWYAAWLRGVCQTHKDFIHDEMMEALRALEPCEGPGGNISFRKEAKKFQRICEKTHERISEIREAIGEIRDRDQKEVSVDDQMRIMMSQTAAYICDIAGCTFIADDPQEALAAFGALAGLARPDTADEKLGSTTILPGTRQVESGALLCDNFRTADYFELSFDLHVNSLEQERASVVQLESGGAFLPAVSVLGGYLCAVVGQHGNSVICIATEKLRAGKSSSVCVRLTGKAFTIDINGRQVGITTTGVGQAPGRLGVRVSACGQGQPAADATLGAVRYRALDMHGKVLHWHFIRGAVQPVISRSQIDRTAACADTSLEGWGNGRCRTRVLRVKNLFHKDTQSVGGYRDLKMWVAIETPAGPLIAEVQLLLRAAFDEKKWMHLPYEYFRGSLDWSEYKPELPPEEDAESGTAGAAKMKKGERCNSDLSDVDEEMLLRSLNSVSALMHLRARGLHVGGGTK